MAGEGSMMHAIITMRNNRRNRISKLERLKNTSNYREDFIEQKKASPELLKSIRTKLQKENKKLIRLTLIRTSFFMIFICILLYIINVNWQKIAVYFNINF
jgi:Flp pilus assembly protein TadB